MLDTTLPPVDCLTTFIKTVFEETERDARTFRLAFGASLRYLLKELSANDYQLRLREIATPANNLNAKDIRVALINSTYFCRDLKVFVLSLLYRLPTDRYELARRRRQYNISNADAKHCLKAIEWMTWHGELSEITALLHDNPDARNIFRIETIQAEVDNFTPELLRHSLGFVHRKLRFVYTYNNMSAYDLATDMVCKAINAYYKLLPHTYSPEHLLNYLRRSCNNHGLNLIQFYTAQKRERLTNNNGDKTGKSGNSLLVVSENQIKNRDVTFTDLADQSSAGAVEVFSGFDKTIVVDRIIGYVANSGSPKKMRLLQILTGVFDKEFTQYLQREGYMGDNDDIMEQVDTDTYLQLASGFLGVTLPQVKNFFAELRTQFA